MNRNKSILSRLALSFCAMVAASFVATGCSTVVDSMGINWLLGEWETRDESPRQTLAFLRGQGFEVDINGDGTKDVWGTYRTSDSRIWFVNEAPGVDLKCGDFGVYSYRIKSGTLYFELVGDQCLERINALSSSWKRAPRNPQ